MAAQAGASFSQSPQTMAANMANGGDSSNRAGNNIDQLPDETKTLLSSILQQGGASGLQQVLASVTPQRSTGKPGHLSPIKPNLPPSSVHGDAAGHQTTPPVSWAGRKRQRGGGDHEEGTKRRRGYSVGKSADKQNKGLRHFSQLVCEKVREKGTTTYNEVADELVKELGEHERDGASGSEHIDQKNIRRRVYDALNVLMAMNIISKEKKEIHWIGLPTNSVQECEHIQDELSQSEQRIQTKKSELHTLLIQILTMKALVRRNKEQADRGETPTQNSAIGLPFILVNTSKSTTIDCSISSDKSEYVFNFDHAFELHQDFQVLKKMGLDFSLTSGCCTSQNLAQAKSMLPKVFEPALEEMAHMSALRAAPPVAISTLPISTNTPSQLPVTASISTPASCSFPPAANPLLTPLLGDNSNSASSVSSTQSPLASLIMGKTPPNSAMMAALQQLQQQTAQSPFSRALSSTSLTPTGLSSRTGTVTARPLNFASSPLPGRTHNSPAVQPKLPSAAPPTVAVSSSPLHSKSPGTKIVTAQPIPSTANLTVAEILASLQKQPPATSPGAPVVNGGLPSGLSVNPLHTQSVGSATPVSSTVSPLTPSTPNLLS